MVTIVAGDGVTLLTDEDKSVSGSAAAIGDPGDTLSYGVTRNPVNGSVAGDAATGAFTYTPTVDFFGNDSFDVMVVDGHGGSDTLRVEVTVAAVNDAPRPTTSTPLSATGNEEAAITGTVAMTDPEANRMTFQILDAAKNGRVNIDQDGKYTYTGNKDFFGVDTFAVKVTDIFGASTEVPVTVTVNNVQDAPVFRDGPTTFMSAINEAATTRTFAAVDADGDTLTYHIGSLHPQHGDLGIDPATGRVTYTAEEDYLGSDRFTMEARDTHGNVTALTVNVQVSPPATLFSQNSFIQEIPWFGATVAIRTLVESFNYDTVLVEKRTVGGDEYSGDGLYHPLPDFFLPLYDFSAGTLGLTSLVPGAELDLSVIGELNNGGPFSLPTGTTGTSSISISLLGATYSGSGTLRAYIGTYHGPDGGTLEDVPVLDRILSSPPLGGFEAEREGALASNPFFETVLDFLDLRNPVGTMGPFPSDLGSFTFDADAPQVVVPEISAATAWSGLTSPFFQSAGAAVITYWTVRDKAASLITTKLVGGTWSDQNSDGDFDFHGEMLIGRRDGSRDLLRITGGDYELDTQMLHVRGGTVFAKISEAAGLHDALFKGDFDIDLNTGEILAFSTIDPPDGSPNPYYSPAGLVIDYEGFAIGTDQVNMFGKMAMPVPLFDGLTLDLKDLTGLLDNGGFTFAADHYGLAGGSVTFGGIEADFFGLFEAEAEKLTLTYDNTKNEFSIDGEIKIKSPVLELIPGAEEPELTFSDMKLKDGKLSFNGELAIESLKLPGGFGLSDVALALTLTDNVVTAFSGETHVTFGDGKPEPIFGIGFQRPPLSFDKITLGVDSLGVHLGDGVFLEKIQGTLEHLADVPPETAPGVATTFTGTLGFGWGPEVAAFELPEFLGGAEVGGGRIANLEITGTMDFENTFDETITLNFLSDNLIKMTGSATLDLGQNMFSGLFSYDVLDGIATGQMLTVSNGHGITAHGNQTITAPSLMEWGPLSGAAGLAVDAFLSISTDVRSQSFFAAWTTFNNLPFISGPLVVGFKIDAANGFSLITGGDDLPKTNSFDVSGTEDWLLITASWENETAGHVATQVRLPDGSFITEAEYADHGIALLGDLTNAFKTAIVIDHPDAGNYDLQVIQPGVGAVKYHGIASNPAENFIFDTITSSPGATSVGLSGALVDAPIGSVVSFFYDTDASGFDGLIIGAGTVSADGSVSATWTLSRTPGGDYHVYAVAFDGMNAPTMIYSPDIVHVALAPTDITVNGRASAAGSPDVSVREDTRPGSVIGRLGVIDPDFGGSATFTLIDDAGGRFVLSGDEIVLTSRAFLDADSGPSGQTPIYTIAVQATDASGLTITRDVEIEVTDIAADIRYVMGTENSENLSGSASGSIFIGRGGDDALFGREGHDVAVFSGFRRNYEIFFDTHGGGEAFRLSEPPPEVTVRDLRPGSPDGADHLQDIEIYRFYDGDFTFADLASSPDVTLDIDESDPIAEDAALGTLVATVDIENPLPGEVYTLTLVDSAAGLFQLSGDQILLAGPLDFETTSQYVLKVQASDTSGAVYEQNITVDVSDVDEGAPTTGPATGTPIIVGTVAQGQTLTVDATSVNDPDGILFGGFLWERSTDGGVTFIGLTFFSNDPTYVVVAADVGALLRVTVAIQDVLGNLSAVFSDPTAPVTTTNHAPTGAPVIIGTSLVGETLTADTSGIADDDGLSLFPSFTWVRIRAGVSEGVVGSGETYVVTDADAGARLKLVVDYSDQAGFSEHIESALSAPVASVPGETFPRFEFLSGGGSIRENLFVGNNVGALLFDGVNHPGLTYEIVSDPSGAFELSGPTLKLIFGSALDFEAAATSNLVIRVTDGAGLDYQETVTVTVLDQPAQIGGSIPKGPILDPTVFADVAGLLHLAGDEGLTPFQWINESEFSGGHWDDGTIEVEFSSSKFDFPSLGIDGFIRAFNDGEKEAARDIFALAASFANVNFLENPDASGEHISLAIGTINDNEVGVANGTPGTELFIAQIVTAAARLPLGGDFNYTLLHEFGHTLGLEHGHNNGGTASGTGDPLPHLPLAHDRSAYSVMTYNNTDGAPQSYMMIDIAALQYLYGADFTTNSGDTVYSWSDTTGETFVDGVSLGVPVSNYILMTLWDGGGTDTYDASNYDGGVEIDLRPGEFSTLSVAQLGKPAALGNVGNAYLYYGDARSLIENAIGGAGADTLMGNVGNNRFTGNGGADDIDGGGGTDTAVFTGARADYTVARLGNGDIQITDLRTDTPDGTDVLRHVELFAFLDNTYSQAALIPGPATGTPVIIGTALEGQSLTVDISSITDPDGIQFVGYLWQRSTDGGLTFVDLGDFSPSPLRVVSEADVGAILRVQVGVLDNQGDGTLLVSDPTIPVTTNNHEPTGVPIVEGSTVAGRILTADISGIADADGIPLEVSFTWVRVQGGSEQTVGFGQTYTLQGLDIGARLKVIASYQDGGGITEIIESALSNPVTQFPDDDELSRFEFATGGGTIQENLFGAAIGTILFDGLDNPSLTYSVFDAAGLGLFEMDGNVLKLKDGVVLDFELGGASRLIAVAVFDGDTPVYANTMTVTVVNQPARLGSAAHEMIPDATVYDDVHGLIGFGGGPDGLTTPQWVNETRQDGTHFWDAGPVEVEFAATRDSFDDFRSEFRQGFNDDQQDAARAIFALVSSFTGVDFVETPFSTQPHIKMAIGTLTAGILGIANGVAGDELLVGSVVTGGNPALLGSEFHLTLMHELGHTLGLDHGSNGGFADELPHVPLAHDRSAYSVMIQNFADGTPQSYMMADIATLQFLYGADFNFNGFDTVYTWSETTGETFVNGVSMGQPVSNYILMTVWDGSGNDTYDASNYDGGVEIDLRPGEFSTLSAAQLGSASALGNVGNAYLHYDDNRSLIEHAIGGDGNDTLTGNTASNRLKGNGGDDTIDGQGGGGEDVAVYDGARTDYSLELLGNGDIQVTDLRDGSPDGTDTIREIEVFEFDGFQFSVQDVLNNPPTGAVVIVGDLLVGETLTLDTSSIADTEAVATPFTFQWARVRAGAAQIVGTGDSYTLTADDVGARIKATVFYQDGEAHDEEISSALSAPAAAFAGQEFPRLELAQGGGKIQENIYDGQPVSILLFDGLMNEDLTYTITSDPSGAFELDGVMLRLKLGVGLDFEAAASRQVEITVTDGAGLNYAQTMTVQVLDELPTLGTAAHAPISDPTVAADAAGLLNDGTTDGLSQWVNETAGDGTQSWGPAALKVLFVDATLGSASPLFVREFDAGEKDAARAVFSLISTFAAIELVEGAGPFDSIVGLAIGTASISFNTPGNGALISVAAADNAGGPGTGGAFHAALLRELGHVLGLENGHNGRGADVLFGDPLPHLPLDHDRSAYSVMTANATDGAPQTFMMADIATLQYLYGADFTANNGDTVYSWSGTTGETFVDGVSLGVPVSNYILMTLWDGGGNDTYDASNYDGGVEIDLRPGEFSTLSVAQLGSVDSLGNVGNAYLYYGDTRSLIENAIGGDGADTLKGNSAGNRLTGNGGADDIDGGDGTDTVAFSGAHTDYVAVLLGNGDIVITDLRAGAPDGVDTVRNTENFAFLDGTFAAAALVNDPPVVSGTVTLAPIAEDSPARLITQTELLANASDIDGPTLAAINLAIAAGKGALVDNHDGTWSYTPAADDDTAVSFSYQVSDGFAPAVAASATLDITSVSDAPPITPGTPGDDSFTATTGAERFEAGTGNDTITFDFRLVDATFTWSGNQVTVETPSSHTELTGFEKFVFTDGTVDNSDGSPLIDDLFYYAQYHDVWNAGVDADLHYNVVGGLEGRDPSAFFSTDFYLAVNQDVKAAGVNPLAHFDQLGWQQGRQPSMDFDAAKYLGANPDVAAAQIDPLWHFLGIGASEGRQPFSLDRLLTADGFDYVHYLRNNPDVAAAGVDPLQHFQIIGWQEGRDPNALFDTSGYLSTYTDVAAANINPFDHYNIVGWTEGRDPSTGFDTTDYLAANSDVAAAKVNPLSHFLHFGINEGRSPQADGLWG